MTALGDVIVDALQELLRLLFSPVTGFIERHADGLLRTVVGTPHPNAVFVRPTNGPWPEIYDYYWQTLVPLALLLWALAVGLVIFLEATSHLFGGYHRAKLKRRAISGLLGILSWWWLAALSLRFVDALTGFLVPSLAEVSLFQTLSFSALGVLGLVLALASDLVLFVLIAMIYFVRQVALFLFVLLMPILIALWIPGVGPFVLASRFMRQLAGFYVPFLFMTVPVAVLFRLGGLLGSSVDLALGDFGAWLVALVIPIVAVVSPFVLFWQAGALFFMTDRAAHHTSGRHVRERTARVSAASGAGAHGGRNLARGARGAQAVRRDGQYLLDDAGSRAHRAGSRLRSAGLRVRGDGADGGDRGGGSGGGRGDGGGSGGGDGDGHGGDRDGRAGRPPTFEQRRRTDRRDAPRDDEPDGDAGDDPPYYQ